jgi:hypothetical protein
LKTGIKKTVGSTKVKDLRNPGKVLHRNDARTERTAAGKEKIL